MQPPNLSLDPAANLWSSNSPNNNQFTNTSSPASSANNDSSFGHFGAFQTQSVDNPMSNNGPTFSASTTNSNTGGNNAAAGETFMGVASPQPGGMPSWKWTVMNDKK
jgi:hypothetical protein